MFRILSFTMHRHPLLAGKSFELTNPEELNTVNYYSLIIGPNGTGKSYLLNSLVEAFNEIAMLKMVDGYSFKQKFTLLYLLNDSQFKISTEDRYPIFEKNTRPVEINQIELPQKWLACSVTINDKFPILNYIRAIQIPQYKYLGIRSASNNAFISRITNSTVLYFIEAIVKKRINELQSVYKSLALNPQVEIVFSGGPMLKLERKEKGYSIYKNSSKIFDPHSAFLKKNKTKTSFRADNYRKYIDQSEKLSLIYDFLISRHLLFEKSSKAEMKLTYRINLHSGEGIPDLLEDRTVLSMMLDLELIKIKRFVLIKDSPFTFEEASSGESHLLSSLHGIIANIEDNSLVLIDEPEISLHPNWQIDYIDILKTLVDSFRGVNFLIASHSHLLVSSLKNEESRITSLKRDRDSGELLINELDFETFGWDPESILYNVFEVATLRNKYFELDLRKLISLISTQSQNKDEILRLKDKVSKYILPNEDDPLHLLINQVDNYLAD